MGEFIVSSELSGVQDVGVQAAYMTARLGLQVHHPDQVVRRICGFGRKVCPHHPDYQRWDATLHGCPSRLQELKMILALTIGRPALRQALVEQGLITEAEATKGIQEHNPRRKHVRRRARNSRPSPRPAPAPATPSAIGIARVTVS